MSSKGGFLMSVTQQPYRLRKYRASTFKVNFSTNPLKKLLLSSTLEPRLRYIIVKDVRKPFFRAQKYCIFSLANPSSFFRLSVGLFIESRVF